MTNGLMDIGVDSNHGTRSNENLPLLMTQSQEEEKENGLPNPSTSSTTIDPHSPNEHMAQHLLLSHNENDDTALYSTTPMMTHAHFPIPSSFPNHRESLFLPVTNESPLQQNHRRQRSQSWGGYPVTWDSLESDALLEVRPSVSWLYVPSLRPATESNPPAIAAKFEPGLEDHPSVPLYATVAYPKKPSPEKDNSIGICVLYGIINATIVIPVILSFATIIYRDPIFAPYLHSLIQLTLFSSIVHQLVFSTCSTLPFAIGQVQDAGLIFLSNMATTIVQAYLAGDDDDNNADPDRRMMGLLATTTFTLSLATALLGLSLMAIGHFRLAQYVQLLPTWYVQ